VWVLSDLTGRSPLLRGGAATRSGRPTTPLR